MQIVISDTPTIVRGPAFAGLTVRVPLSATPSQAWLDRLARESLPGKGHRVDGAALEFCLDRESADLDATLTRIANAIATVGAELTGAAAGDREQQAAQTRETREAKASRQLAKWWHRHRPAAIEENTAVQTPATDVDRDAVVVKEERPLDVTGDVEARPDGKTESGEEERKKDALDEPKRAGSAD